MRFSTQDPTRGKTLYHLGLALDCPVDQARAGGFRLLKRSEQVGFDRHGDTTRAPQLGEHAWLSEEQVQRLRDGVARMVVRQVGAGEFVCVSTKPRGWVVGYAEEPGEFGPKRVAKHGTRRIREPEEGDVPLATWVYMERAKSVPLEATPEARPFLATEKPAGEAKAKPALQGTAKAT